MKPLSRIEITFPAAVSFGTGLIGAGARANIALIIDVLDGAKYLWEGEPHE